MWDVGYIGYVEGEGLFNGYCLLVTDESSVGGRALSFLRQSVLFIFTCFLFA
jgi:hypothetical protein